MSDSTISAGGVRTPEDFPDECARWQQEIKFAQRECDRWWKQSREILARYRDERPGRRDNENIRLGRQMNLLWSNVETLKTAIYAAPPDPVVQRRFADEDDVSRVASLMLERVIAYQMEENNFHALMQEVVQDHLLSGRGTVWCRYEPHFGREPTEPLPSPSIVPPMAQLQAPQPGPGTMPMQGMPPGGPGGMPGAAGGPTPPPASPPPGVPGMPSAGTPPTGGPPVAGAAPPIMPQPPPAFIPPMMPLASPQPLLGAMQAATSPAAPRRTGGGKVPDDGGVQVHDESEGDGEFLAWEKACIDHVGWEDWLSDPARTWAEVRWVARRVYLTKDEIADRFGGKLAEDVPLSWHPSDLSEQEAMEPKNQIFCRAEVWEIWDKPSRKVFWIAKDFGEKLLDKRDDPLRLPNFFPTVKPLYATTTTDTLVPIPDYIEYRDQAAEIDNLTARIHAVTRAIKVAGVYDGSQDGIQRLFTEGVENELIPVNTWATFAQQGGLKGCIDIMPVDALAEVLEKLTAVRAQAKQDLYEVTGISDIIRGSTVASETATAQQIKSQFGTMRLRARQAETARFCRDVVRLVADVICEHFQARTILMMSDIAHQESTDAALAKPAIALLKDDKTRPLRIDIEVDSTILADQQQEQTQRIQFLTMTSQFLQQALPAVTQYPAVAPVLIELLKFGIRSFPKGAELEGVFEAAGKQMLQAPAQSPPPDPKMLLAQAQVRNIDSQIADRQMDDMRQGQEAAATIGLDRAKAALDAERERRKGDQDAAQMLHQRDIDHRNVMLDAAKIALDNAHKRSLPAA